VNNSSITSTFEIVKITDLGSNKFVFTELENLTTTVKTLSHLAPLMKGF